MLLYSGRLIIWLLLPRVIVKESTTGSPLYSQMGHAAETNPLVIDIIAM